MKLQPSNYRLIILLLGPIVAGFIYFLSLPLGPSLSITAAVTVLCVIWWVFEPIPIPVTSLIPLSVFQLTGVLSKDEIGSAYGSPLILLLLGGFIISKAMESSGAHRRLALFMINLFGATSSRRLVIGFMVTAAILSMWISNTATTLMLLPVAIAIIEKSKDSDLAAPLMLGIAYAASIGGIGTPIGTPPNLVFMQIYQDQIGASIGFVEWMIWGVPTVILMIPLAGLWVTRKLTYNSGFNIPSIGQWSLYEKRVMLVFAITALLWITRKEPWGGWSELLALPANDASVALLAVVAMFIIPNGRGGQLLDWETAATIPWGVLLLFGGGICLAKAFGVSGLSQLLGGYLTNLSLLPLILMLFLICLGVTFLTETTSNTASTVLLMPILAVAAITINIDPKLLMVPAAISASCAFMMPVATAPNSIVMGSGYLTTARMAQEGLVLNIIGAVTITLLCYYLI